MKEYEAVFQNQPVDVSEEFDNQQIHFFVGSKVPEFDPDTASGKILWKGLALKQRVSYHQLTLQFEDYKVWWDTPLDEYEDEQTLPFSLSFVSPKTVRLRIAARSGIYPDEPSLMLDGDPPTDIYLLLGDDRRRIFSNLREPVRLRYRSQRSGTPRVSGRLEEPPDPM
jgi:alpha-D-xyloside xylohydrolase